MGGLSSKSWDPGQEDLPYPGPAVVYNFINTEVAMTASSFFSKTQNMITTDMDSYYPKLEQKYAEGFRMLTFYRLPVSRAGQTREFFSTSVSIPFQGVFCRYSQLSSEQGMWQLRVVKSVMVTQIEGHGLITERVGHTSDIHQAIVDNTKTGGRLICIEMTGHKHAQGVSPGKDVVVPMGVDLFFDMPTNPGSELYVYQSVPCPVMIHRTETGIACRCDWDGMLDSHLSQGWRLVEVFFDRGEQHRVFWSTAARISVWFFEKPASQVQDNRPVYQGMVITQYIRHTQKFLGPHVQTSWEPVIQQMGNHGWEFACSVETPETRLSGSGKGRTKVLLLFQRPVLPPVVTEAQTISGPSYTRVPVLPPTSPNAMHDAGSLQPQVDEYDCCLTED